MLNLIKRIITSLILISTLIAGLFYYKNIWQYLVILVTIISYLELSNLIKKIWNKNNIKKYFINLVGLCYFLFFAYTANDFAKLSAIFFFVLSICIFSDIGGYVIGKTIGGKKLTKISPNKTISGTVGSFIFSLVPLIIIWSLYSDRINLGLIKLLILTIIFSFICQVGDLFISFLKRKANVKDTGTILPGHGGLLDRIDGILFVVPVAYIINEIFYL